MNQIFQLGNGKCTKSGKTNEKLENFVHIKSYDTERALFPFHGLTPLPLVEAQSHDHNDDAGHGAQEIQRPN